MKNFAVILWMLLAMPLCGQDTVAAARDLATVPAQARASIRYLSLKAIPEKDHEEATAILSGHGHGLSRESDINRFKLLPGGIVRLNLEDFTWSASVWEKLADADPYYHVKVRADGSERPWPGGVWPDDGKFYAAGSFKYIPRASTVPAPWLEESSVARAAYKYLTDYTRSAAPIVRGDWFLFQTSQQTDRKPGYYDFLDIKDRKGFEKLIGFDAKIATDAKRKELLEAVAESRVAQQPRRIAAFNTVGGMKYWRTFDSKLAVDKKNPLRVLDGSFEHDAEESFGPLPNNFWAWGLFDADGKRQDSAPDFIGPDPTSSNNNGRIEVGVSCIRCHYSKKRGAEAGLQNINGWARNLFVGKLELKSPDYYLLRDLRQKYLRDLEGSLADDRRTHARAVMEATGMEPGAWSKGYGEMFARYESSVDAERAARDAGMNEMQFVVSLEAYLERIGSIDPVLGAFIQGQRVPIRQYEEAFSLMILVSRGIQP